MKRVLFLVLALLAWLFPAVVAVHNVLSGSIPFWYDPARDMLSAWDNFSKITLIGPPSGIPGIFYGPYWIWWLSIGEIFSKDPKIVDFLIITLPYLIIFPFVLFLFSRIFDKLSSVLLWLLFVFTYKDSFQNYMIFIWNPNLAPLLFISIIYLLVSHAYKIFTLKNYLRMFFAGVLTGLVLNIHISFSVGFTIGAILFLLINFIFGRHNKSLLKSLGFIASYLVGVIVVFIPFFIFELRHGFSQTHTAVKTILLGGDVVLQKGMSKPDIIFSFINKFSLLLKIPFVLSIIFLALSILLTIFLFLKKKISLSAPQIRLLGLLGSVTFCVLAVYLSAKNPIWDYHFIGADIVCLLAIGFLISKIKPLQYFLFIWILYLSIFQVQGFIKSFSVNQITKQSLFAEEYIVKSIQKDAGRNVYTVYVYNPAIYSYEYSYLFRAIANKNFSYDPGQIQRKGIVYLILPQAKKEIIDDFIHYHTPPDRYLTLKTWQIPNGTTVLKRELKP